jgi:hypothetical protein
VDKIRRRHSDDRRESCVSLAGINPAKMEIQIRDGRLKQAPTLKEGQESVFGIQITQLAQALPQMDSPRRGKSTRGIQSPGQTPALLAPRKGQQVASPPGSRDAAGTQERPRLCLDRILHGRHPQEKGAVSCFPVSHIVGAKALRPRTGRTFPKIQSGVGKGE